MTAPPAEGRRVPYDAAPPALRAWVDERLGSPVVAATTQPGGFSPGVMQGGPEPEEMLAMSSHGRAADAAAVTTLVATVTGYFLVNALKPPSPGLPTVRDLQVAQDAVALQWLKQRTGWR